MSLTNKCIASLLFFLSITACNTKNKEISIPKEQTGNTTKLSIPKNEESIEGVYRSNECELSVVITKTKDGYDYLLKTSQRKVKGKASFTKSESGENYLTLEGIKWDEYEGDISQEDETDSIPTKELEIPVGIDASYVKDTLTIQNYGNAMNSYTKISECGSKYIQLIKIPNR
ncbi:hypothetical protein GKZ90_0019705 [Flavobacterium sp. MC2016-06]|uniref:hypothetical protein n=1 Tax=Flavobacterium sp. MC2016-06 TaxID=2676308 RepID=UPI0012BAD9C2|nr:hypothetical protein [Flavobacterium sp. MC2016-06]MBU3861407.1 hypothetical protein [Flavobacterium sp. MC2016-06]